MGFRPQPVIDDNIIRISDNPREQVRIASSLRLFRDGQLNEKHLEVSRSFLVSSLVYLTQRADAKTEKCTDKEDAADLPPGHVCAFNWFHIVENDDHPCSDNNMYGFRKEEPCILVKVNKVRGETTSRRERRRNG